ncbi:DinB superfamily protein [Flavobacteriaceae bacterium MAR_2010_188]|nr:DinB superfamily protein [Flavobacteriaceae bacterium MAR_2010_188]
MHKDEIADLIDDKSQVLVQFLQNQKIEKWRLGPENKWTTGQQALHLLQSVIPLNTALSLPRFIIRTKYGKTNRSLRTYNEIVKRYLERLAENPNVTFGPSKNMKVPSNYDKHYIVDRLQIEHKKLSYKIRKISDPNLDELVLPHPLMGKMPVREILMWTAYHIEHHTNQLQKSY